MDALIRRSIAAGERCVCAEPDRTIAPGRGEAHPGRGEESGGRGETHPEHGEESGAVYLPWGLRSPLSARSLLSTVRNRFGSIDRATVVAAPAASAASIAALPFSEIERYIDEEVRSIVFLTRELLQQLPDSSDRGLTLVLVEPDGGGAVPMQSLASGAIGGFYASVLEQYRESGPPVFGFVVSADERDIDALVDFVYRERTGHTSRARGRLQRFGERTGLRSLFRH